MLSFVWAESINGGIGHQGKLPWNNKTDMKHFKEITSNEIVIIGMNTFRSMNSRPLSNRENFVITHNANRLNKEKKDKHLHFMSLEDIEYLLNQWESSDYEVFVIGGRSIFESIYQKHEIKRLHRSIILEEHNFDTEMIEIDYDKYQVDEDMISKDGTCEFVDYVKGE